MLQIVRSLVFDVFFYSWTTLMCLSGGAVSFSPSLARGVGTLWSRGSLYLMKVILNLTYRLEGKEHLPNVPCLFAMKHQSAWDTIFYPSFLQKSVIVFKKELTYVPLFGWIMKRSGMIPIDRKNPLQAMKVLLKLAKARLQHGLSVFIFPEGRRYEPGQETTYQPGVALLYSQLKVPVVPVALNSGVFWPRRSFIKKPGVITIRLLPPIQPNLPKEVFLTTLQKQIEQACTALI